MGKQGEGGGGTSATVSRRPSGDIEQGSEKRANSKHVREVPGVYHGKERGGTK